MFGLVFTLALSTVSAMPSASVTCPGWPASCDGAWGAMAADIPTGAATDAATDDATRDYATPAEIDCPTPPEPAPVLPVATGECSEPPLNLWYRVSRFPESEAPTGSLAPAPRRARPRNVISAGRGQDVGGHLSAPDVQQLALFALPGLVPTSGRDLSDVSTRVIPARALAPPDRPPRA